MAQILLIRHGQASAGKRNYDVLSSNGFEQARLLGEALKARGIVPDRILTGTMTRHKQTAMGCLTAMGIPHHWHEDARFNEFDHQNLLVRYRPLYRSRALMTADLVRTLKPKQAFRDVLFGAMQRWVSGKHDAEYSESWPAYQTRVQQAITGAVEHDAKTTLVFTSGGAISATVAQLWGLPADHWITMNSLLLNTGITKLVTRSSGLQLSSFNEHSHLEGEQRNLLTYI